MVEHLPSAFEEMAPDGICGREVTLVPVSSALSEEPLGFVPFRC
jgi:hypothetical protein